MILRNPAAAAFVVVLLVATLSSLVGCGREHAEADPPGKRAAAATTAANADPPLPGARDEVPPPQGVLRAYVWDCDGGLRLRMKNLYREDAVTLELHEGPRKLPHVLAASGAKYSDGSLTFWTKGSTAILERAGGATVSCRELRAESLIADARERGVRYRGAGNEPGWVIEIGPGSHLLYAGDYGQDRREFDDVTERDGGTAGVLTFDAGAGPQRIAVTVTPTACNDDMSGAEFEFRMDVEVADQRLRGCATVIR